MKIALFADYHGGERVWPQLEEALEDERLDLIVFAGDILDSPERETEWQRVLSGGKPARKPVPEEEDQDVIEELAYREFFINLTGFGVPVLYVPGHIDSPTTRLERVAAEFTNVTNLQASPYESGEYTFVGWGGALGSVDSDDRFYCTDERKFKKQFNSGFQSDPTSTILVVHTPPVSRVDLDPVSDKHVGSKSVSEIVEKHQPAFCFCGHAHGAPGQDTIGSTVVVNSGPMFKGRYALIDTQQHKVIFPTSLKV